MIDSRKATILFLDDEDMNVLLFNAAQQSNFNILTATEPTNALEILQNHPEINVVISDYKMGEMNGLEFIKTAKLSYPKKAYMLLTAFDFCEDIDEAIDSGLIAGCLEKPMNRNSIKESIEKVLDTID